MWKQMSSQRRQRRLLQPLLVLCGLVSLGLLASPIACGPPQNCNTCTPGAQRCDNVNQAILICAKGFTSECYTWGSIPCPQGGVCELKGSEASCSGGQGCKDECTVGEKRCSTNGVQECLAKQQGACAGWGDVLPCPNGEACVAGSCSGGPPTCPSSCKVGDVRCSGNAVQTCEQGAGPCPEWGSTSDCPKTTICQAGKCEDNCKNLCTVGDVRCSGNAIQACVAEKNSGCPLWGEPLQCPSGQTCQGGACTPDNGCKDACTAGQKKCDGNGVQTCAKGTSGCLEWSSTTACAMGQTCKDGTCEGSCTDACTAGEKKCGTGGVQTCAAGASGCLEWGKATACPSGQSCQGGACKPGCTDACKAGEKKCGTGGVQTCAAGASGCLEWGKATACPSGQTCQGGACKATCQNACTAGQKRCQGNNLQTCKQDAKGCLVWDAGTACTSPQVCDSGKCVDPGDPALRSQQTVCTRWKKDFAANSAHGFKNSGGCDPGSISQQSIDDAITRINLYRWMIGLTPTAEDPSLSQKTQACAILQANNDGPGAGVNAHKPPTSWKCYNQTGAAASGASNLSWGVHTPAETITQYISDHRVSSLGHRLWIISKGFTKTGIGMATGTGRYRVASCLYTFARGSAPAIDYVAMPPPGNVPIQAMGGTRHPVKDWSFNSTKYAVSALKEVTMIRKSDNDTQKVAARKISGYGQPAGLTWRPRFPVAGEEYTVKLGTIYTYTVKFFDCK